MAENEKPYEDVLNDLIEELKERRRESVNLWQGARRSALDTARDLAEINQLIEAVKETRKQEGKPWIL